MSWLSDVKHFGEGLVQGLAITVKHLFRPWITVQYPEQKLNMSRRLRGSDVIWRRDTCIACHACERACPTGCIQMESSRGEDRKLKVDHISIDFGLCIFCGLCVEACPTGVSIYMSRGYERTTYLCIDDPDARTGKTPADHRCRQLVLTNDELLPSETRQVSGYDRPEVSEKLPTQTLLLSKTAYFANKATEKGNY